MASTWLYPIRHGEVRDAAGGRFIGHTDVPLSEAGLDQILHRLNQTPDARSPW